MTLLTTGYIALGGNVAGRSVAKELNDGAPNFTSTISLNDSNVRTLAQKTSGTISLSDLRGKSHGWTATVTSGFTSAGKGGNIYRYGYGSISPTQGSITDTTLDPKSNATIQYLRWVSANRVELRISGYHTNSGFTTMTIGSTSFSRSSASFSASSYTMWTWNTSSNPFGTSGTQKTVTIV